MRKAISIIVTAILIITIFSCSHKKDYSTSVIVDTASSSSYKIMIFPGEFALYNLSIPYKFAVRSGMNLIVPLVVTKQKVAIAGSSAQTMCQFNFQRDTSMSLSFPIVTDSLGILNYRYDSVYARNYSIPTQLINFSLSKIPSTVYYQSDNLNLNITSFASGKVSGNFTMRLTPIFTNLDYTYRGSVYLDGSFNNIKVNY